MLNEDVISRKAERSALVCIVREPALLLSHLSSASLAGKGFHAVYLN